MAYDTPTNETIGISGFFNYMNSALKDVIPIFGSNAIGFIFILPLWFIIFLPLARASPVAAWTVASFVCWLVAVFMVALQYLHESAFWLLMIMWIAGAAAYYLQTRP